MVQYESAWISNTSKQHLVPNTYLKSWSNNNDHVYYIDKNEKVIDFNQSDFQRKTKKLTIIKEFYSRNIYTNFFEANDLVKIFEPLTSKNYSVIYESKEIVSLEELKSKFYYFSAWEIFEGKNKLISKEKKEELKKEIRGVQIRDIEEAWNRMFESTWPNTREALLNAVNSNLGINRIKAIKREELLRFMVAMEWRTFPPNPQLLEELNKIPLDALNEPLDEEEKYLPTINTYGEHILHDLNLKFFKRYFKNDGPIHEQFAKINEEMDVELLVPETGYEFITSDNPIKIFENANKELEYIFAITPNLACAIRKNSKDQDKNKYWLTTYPKEKVFDFNKNVKEASYRGYILKQPNLGVYFK